MKFLIALACLLAFAYAAEEAKPVDNSADLAVDEHGWRSYHGGQYGHYRPHGYGHFRGRRSADIAAPAEEADQSVDEQRYHGWGGYRGGWGGYHAPHYGGYHGHYRGRRSAEEVDQGSDEHRYRGWGGYHGYYRPHGNYYGGFGRPYYG